MAIKWFRDTEYTAYCSRCGYTESIYSSDNEYRKNDTPSKYFARQGWRGLKRESLCPACAAAAQKEDV